MSKAPSNASPADIALAYLRLPHAVPILAVMSTTVALVWLIDSTASWPRRAGIIVAMLGAQIVIGVVNELSDLDVDRLSRPDKPLVSGIVSELGARLMLVAGLALMLGAGLTLGLLALGLCLLGCGIGVAYSLWFKRSVVAWLPYLVAVPLLPIWVAIALGRFHYRWLLLYPLGSCALIAVQIAQSVPDVTTDKAAGIRSLTTVLGERRSLLLCWMALSISAAIIALTNLSQGIVVLAAALVVFGVVGNVWLYAIQPRGGVAAAFPIAAAGTALLGIVWVYALRTS